MKFTILRLLTHSELGMFHEYRRQGKERAKQRAINFDWDVVDTVFPAAKDSERIAVECSRLEDDRTVVTVKSWLKRQHKNWRFEGDCPTTPYYSYVAPDALFAMVVDAATTPARASWVVLPLDHPARSQIVNHAESARLSKSRMIALYDDDGAFCQSVLSQHFPQLFSRGETVPVTHTPTPVGHNEVAPDPLGLFHILARAGHGLPSAVADLVDNSLSHKANVIDVHFPNPNDGGRWLCVRDDGEGMTPEGLRDAMRIGHQRAYEDADLGKFGYGLKGAAWSQADRLTVISKAAGHDPSVLTWDKDHLARTRRWELLADPVAQEHAAAVELGESGTAVLLTRMRPTMEPVKGKGLEPYALELAAVRDHLELVFHKYLEGKVPGREKVVMRLNGDALRPNNPMGHPLTKVYEERRIELPSQEPEKPAVLAVRAFITPNEAEFEDYHEAQSPVERRTERERLTLNGRWNDTQGLYFYRLHRLIKWGGWEGLFAIDEHTKLLRVAVDFDRLADEQLQVDISKQLVRLPFNVADGLKNILKSPRADARSRYDKKVKPTVGQTVKPTVGQTPPVGAGKQAEPKSPGPVQLGIFGKPPPVAPTPPTKDKSALRVVSTGSAPWERKTGFGGEHVEITPVVPELVALTKAIDKDAEAKAALSEFLRVLEKAGVPQLLTKVP